jgi:hypothetical protein
MLAVYAVANSDKKAANILIKFVDSLVHRLMGHSGFHSCCFCITLFAHSFVGYCPMYGHNQQSQVKWVV